MINVHVLVVVCVFSGCIWGCLLGCFFSGENYRPRMERLAQLERERLMASSHVENLANFSSREALQRLRDATSIVVQKSLVAQEV